MNEPFNIPIVYQGEELEFKARFERWGYTHRFVVLIGETTVTFEPDDEGGYRALGDAALTDPAHKISRNLLQAVAEKLIKLGN